MRLQLRLGLSESMALVIVMFPNKSEHEGIPRNLNGPSNSGEDAEGESCVRSSREGDDGVDDPCRSSTLETDQRV